MSVPTWKRGLSKTQYLYSLYELNIYIGKMCANCAKKYRNNYSDQLIKTALEALKYAQVANSIFMCKTMPEEDKKLRRKCLLKSRGLVENIATVSFIFLELVKRNNEASYEKVNKQEEHIGLTTDEIVRLINGVLRSDKDKW